MGYSFAIINFHPQTLITQQDLKTRANSVVFNKYRQIKREIAKREQQRRLNWFMSVVKCKAWASKMVKRVRANLAKQKQDEAFQKQNTISVLTGLDRKKDTTKPKSAKTSVSPDKK